MQSPAELRQERGMTISMIENQIRRETDFEYFVRSQSKSEKEYRVVHTMQGWGCTCPDYLYRNIDCKHICSTILSKIVRIRKYGIRKNKSGVRRIDGEICREDSTKSFGNMES